MISVIIPVYNIEKYIESCVRSVSEQKFAAWEVILVDDGSTDRSGAICDSFAESDERIRVIHQINSGLSAARNAGLALAGGDRIAFVDGDDRIGADMLQTLSDIMDRTDCDIVQCAYLSFEGSLPPEQIGQAHISEFSCTDAMRELIRNRAFQQTVWNKLYKRSCLQDLSFPVGKYHEDEFFTWQAFYRAEKICATDAVGYYYRQRQGSIMGVSFSEKRLDALEAIRERTEFFKTAMPVVYADSCAALFENYMYQYQCFSVDPSADPDGKCRKQIKAWIRSSDADAAVSAVGAKQKMWIRLFCGDPDKTAALRNRMRIGF